MQEVANSELGALLLDDESVWSGFLFAGAGFLL